MTVCTTAMTSQASEPIIVNMKMWSLAPTSTLMKAVSDVVRDRKHSLHRRFATRTLDASVAGLGLADPDPGKRLINESMP